MHSLGRLILAASVAVGALQLSACTQMMSCVASNVFEPQLLGPFVNVPSARDVDRAPDAVTTGSQQIYFLWMNPDMEEGDTYSCEILTVEVDGLDEGVLMGSATGEAEARDFRGPVLFTAPPQGWLAGSYEARMSRNGAPFDTVTFDVLP